MLWAIFSVCLTGFDEDNYRVSCGNSRFSFKFRVFNKSKTYDIILFIRFPLSYQPCKYIRDIQ